MKKKYKSIVLFATANLLVAPVITTYAEECLTDPKVAITQEEAKQEKTVATTTTTEDKKSQEVTQTTETSRSEEAQEASADKSEQTAVTTMTQQETSDKNEKTAAAVSGQEKIIENSGDGVSQLTETSEKATETLTFDFLGLSNRNFGTLRFTKEGKLVLTLKGGRAHSGFGTSTYASIKITNQGTATYTKVIRGNDWLPNQTEEITLKEGDQLTIYHAEPNRFVVSDANFKSKDGNIKTYNYQLAADQTLKNITDSVYLKEEVQTLFKNEEQKELSESANQVKINELKKKLTNGVYQVEEQEKQELLQWLEKAQQLINQLGEVVSNNQVLTQEIFTLPQPAHLLKEGRRMAANHDRQDLGIVLEGQTQIQVRQANDHYSPNVTLRLLGNDSKLEMSKTISKEWTTIDVATSLVPYIETPYTNTQTNEQPKIELKVVQGVAKKIPTYDSQTQIADFLANWTQSKASFAVVKGRKFQMLIPVNDFNQVKSIDLPQLVHEYDEQVFQLIDKLTGLEVNSSDPIHEEEKQRYFIKADANGAGAAYYGGSWTAQNSTSMASYLSINWLPIHEIAHGYEVPSKEMIVVDVLNNVYGTYYQQKYLTNFIKDSWLFRNNKQGLINNVKTSLLGNHVGYNEQGYQEKLLLFMILAERLGQEGFAEFNKYHRQLANEGKAVNDLVQLFIEFGHQYQKYNLIPYFQLLGLTVDDQTATQFLKNDSQPVAMVTQVVPDSQIEQALQMLGLTDDLDSQLTLVTNQELQKLNLTSQITVNIKNSELLQNGTLRLKNGQEVVKEVTVKGDQVTLENMPNGVYAIESSYGHIVFDQQYLYVKEDGTVEIMAIDNYILKRVQELYETQEYTTLSPDLTQEQIDRAKVLVADLAEGPQKEANTALIEKAQNMFKQWLPKGLGNATFARIRYFEDGSNRFVFTTNSTQPHYSYGDPIYFALKIKDPDGTVIYDRKIKGPEKLTAETLQWTLKPGTIITVTHVEPSRLHVNDDQLKPRGDQTITNYEIDDAGKIVKVQQDWNYTETDSAVILTKYIGSSKDIIVPKMMNGLPVQLKAINSTVLPKDMTSFSISQEGTGSVTLQSKTLKSAFDTFPNLTDVDLRGLDTTGVKDFSRMFSNCKKLVNVDLSGMDTSAATNMNRMFNECDSLEKIDLSSFDLTNVTDKGFMFFVYQQKPLVVVTKDQHLLQYNFATDHRVPHTSPKLEANGGVFADSTTKTTTVKQYFTSCAVTIEQIQLASFEAFKESNVPVRTGYEFNGWKVKETKSEGTVFDLLDTIYTASWKETSIHSASDNDKVEYIYDSFGIAYFPKNFETDGTILNKEGEQSIPIKKKESFNVGVFDQRTTNSPWTLTAKLKWLSQPIVGAYIQTTNETGKITKNTNDGSKEFDATTDLKELSGNQTVTGTSQAKIETVPSVVMNGEGSMMDGVYDYNLEDVTLEIPAVEKVAKGEYQATIEWNLTSAP